MATQIQIRRDTAANWTSEDPTLAEGEFGFETDTDKIKIGDGATAWTSLGYFGAGLSDGDMGDVVVSGSGTVLTIDNGVVTYAKMQDVSATDRFLGRDTAGSGDVEEITPTNAKAMLAIAQADVSGLGTGNVPQFSGLNLGHASDTQLLRSGAGNVTVAGNYMYRAGGTDVPVADGGTGASTAATARPNLGIQCIRETTTGSIAASGSANVTLTWPSTFGDANYTVTVSAMQSANNNPPALKLISKSATQIVVRVLNQHAGAAQTFSLDAIGIHD